MATVSKKKIDVVENGTVQEPVVERIVITPPRFRVDTFLLIGTSPYVQNRFSAKAMRAMMEKMAAGSTARTKRIREARNFNEDFEEAIHFSSEGWVGIPAAAFRNAAIAACRMTGYKMTHAKMSIFVLADGFDRVDGTPLVKLIAGAPEMTTMPVRNQTGVVDIRVRPMWRKWMVRLQVQYDMDQFTQSDVGNLLLRAGIQVGIGEGRPSSRESNGLGYGLWTLGTEEDYAQVNDHE